MAGSSPTAKSTDCDPIQMRLDCQKHLQRFKLSKCYALVLCRSQLEEQLQESRQAEGDNAINLALAEEIQSLQERQSELEAEAQELREQNDLLEFRILELDDGVCAHSCSSFHFKVGNVIRDPIVIVGELALFQELLWTFARIKSTRRGANILNTTGKYKTILKRKVSFCFFY